MWLPDAKAMRVELRALGVGDRVRLWRSQLVSLLTGPEVAELATRYRLADDDAIQGMLADAASRALLRGADQPAMDDFRLAARAIATPPLEGLARHVEPRYGWDDIVLPPDGLAQLHEVCARLRHQGTVLEQWGYGRKHARRGGMEPVDFTQPAGPGPFSKPDVLK